MTSNATCPGCGQLLPADAPQGRCPECLFDLLDEAEAKGDSDAQGRSNGTTQIFGDYELIEEIGRGGMGVVYKARQISLGRTVALKVMLGGQFAAKELIQRFRAEAGAAAALRHPNIVAIHDVGVYRGQHYFSMDHVDGQNLSQVVRNQPLSPAQAARYVKLVSEAIHFGHQHGIVHRDLKPSNVLVDSATDQPLVTDFGLAKRLDGDSSLTLSGVLLGSPSFMPPEQASPDLGKVGRPGDVYSLGGILYYLLTARPPFQSDTLQSTIHQLINTEPIPPRILTPSVPRDLETICLKCLEKDPSRRYATPKLLADELDRFLKHEPIAAHPIGLFGKTARWCRRKPALAASLALVLILLLVIVIGSPIALYRINQEKHHALNEASTRRVQLYAHEVNLAQEALAEANLSLARQLLDQQRPRSGETNDLRAFEWRYVHAQTKSDEMATLGPFSRPPTAVSFAPSGLWFAATDENGDITLWDHLNKKVIARLPAYTNSTQSTYKYEKKGLALTPDGRTLAAGVGNAVVLWDLETRRQMSVLREHTSVVTYLAFSHDGRILASASMDGTARFWKMTGGSAQPVGVLEGNFPAVSLAFSDDGALFALGTHQSRIRLWDISDLAAPRELPSLKGFASSVHALAFAPGSHRLVSAPSGQIIFWNLDAQGHLTSTNRLRSARASLGAVGFLAFSPDGRTLVSAGTDRNLTLWDLSVAAHDPVILKGHEGEIYSVSFSPDGRLVASASFDGSIKLWDVSEPWRTKRQMSHGAWLYSVVFSPDNKLLASAAQQDTIKLWDVATESLLAERPLTNHCWLLFSPDGTLLAASNLGIIRLLALPSLTELTNFPGSLACFSVDSSEVIYFYKGAVQRRNLKTHIVRQGGGGWKPTDSLTVSPDRQFIAGGGSPDFGMRREVRLWNFDSLSQSKLVGLHAERVHNLNFSPDGHWLASASWDGTNRLWNLVDPSRPAISLAAHNGGAWAAVFSPDGRTLATCGDDNAIRLWNLASFQQAATLRGHTASVTSLAFSSDGTRLASGSGDGTVRIWHAPTLDEIARTERGPK